METKKTDVIIQVPTLNLSGGEDPEENEQLEEENVEQDS
jgi:hypothetical protein